MFTFARPLSLFHPIVERRQLNGVQRRSTVVVGS
jgi:hypothetical protein